MKKIIDVSTKIVGGYIAALGISRKMQRYWGTDTIDGIEVFSARRYIYPRHLLDVNANGTTHNTTKLLKLMDAYEDVAGVKMKGIASAWLYLNPAKLSSTSADYFTKEWIADMIDSSMEINKEYTFYVNFTSVEYNNGSYSDPKDDKFSSMTNEQILAYVFSNYQEMYDKYNLQGRADKLITLEELSKFLPFNTETYAFTITPVVCKIVPILKTHTDANLGTSYTYIERTISVEYKAKRLAAVNENGALVNKILTESNEAEKAMIIADSQVNSDDILYNPPTPVPNPVMFYKGQLRVDYYENLEPKDRLKLFGMLMDQGYEKEKTKWWKKALIIVVIIAVVYFSGGGASGWAATFGSSATAASVSAAIAWTATMVALSMAVVSMYGAKNGEYGASEYAGKWGNKSGKLAMIAGLYAIVSGAYQAVANEYAKQTAEKSVTQAVMDAIRNSARESLSSVFKKVSMFSSTLYGMYTKNQMEDVNAETASVKAESEALRQEQTLADDEVYVSTLEPLDTTDKHHQPLVRLQEDYYARYEVPYEGTKFNVMHSGPFKGIGCFSAKYT